MNIQTNDKIRVKYGDKDLIFIGLEEALNDFNEDNLNKIVQNVMAIIEKENMNTDEYHKIWKSQMTLLKQDYSFTLQEGDIIFKIGNASLHRKNEKLVNILNEYIDYVFDKNTETEFKIPKSKKNKEFKILESKGGIKESNVDVLIIKELNLNNLLTIIGNNRQQNEIKF